MDAIVLHGAAGDFGQAHVAKEWKQVHFGSPVLAGDITFIALPLCNHVILAQVLRVGFAKDLLGFDFAVAEFSPQLQIPILGDFLRFGQAFLFGGAVCDSFRLDRSSIATDWNSGVCRYGPCRRGYRIVRPRIASVKRLKKPKCVRHV